MFSKSDYIRLNLSCISDFPQMFVEKSKEFYNIDILNLKVKVSYYDFVSNSHGSPLNGVVNWGGRIENAPRNYPGWQGSISFFAENNKNIQNDSAANTIFNHSGFRGFHTSGGCPGRINEYPVDIGFYFFLEDFPKLVKSKEMWNKLKTFNNNKESWSSIDLNYSN